MKVSFLFGFFMLFLCSINLNAENTFSDFLQENNEFILSIQENKIYIDKKNISIESDGFNISDSFGKGFKVKELFSDDQGIYITVSSITSPEKVWNIVYCKTCKTYRSINIEGKCNVCGKNPSE